MIFVYKMKNCVLLTVHGETYFNHVVGKCCIISNATKLYLSTCTARKLSLDSKPRDLFKEVK